MSEEVYERIRRRAGINGQDGENPQHPPRQSATGILLPPMTVEMTAYTGSISVPEIRPYGRDRRSRREADEARREAGRMVHKAIKARVVMDAVRAVTTYGAYSIDQAQEEMMEMLYAKERHEGMNEMMAQVIAQAVQQVIAQTLALGELHYKRQTEEL